MKNKFNYTKNYLGPWIESPFFELILNQKNISQNKIKLAKNLIGMGI